MGLRNTPRHTAGWWLPRLGLRILGLLLGLLFFWLLGFAVTDIRTLPVTPGYSLFREERRDAALEASREKVREELALLTRELGMLESRQKLAREGIRTLENTMKQLGDLRGLTGGKEKVLEKALSSFLEKQRIFQENNARRIALAQQQEDLRQKLEGLDRRMDSEEKTIRRSYAALRRKEEFRRGLYQLGFLIPLLLACLWLCRKTWNSLYRSAGLALTVAVFIHTALTAHASFPIFYMKYTLLGAGILVAFGLMALIVRSIQRPRRDSLLKTYREGYRHFLCPVCGYPIRRGPLRFASWTRKTVFRMMPQNTFSFSDTGDEPYHCPSCGTELYSLCPFCGHLRETLLPACSFCGAGPPQETPPEGPDV